MKKTVLAFSAKISGVIQEAVSLMTIFTEEFISLPANLAAADGAFVLQSVCSGFQHQNSFCPGFVLQVGPDLAA